MSPAIIAEGVADPSFTAWLDAGQRLYTQRKDLDWACADWIAEGLTRYPDQLDLGLLGGLGEPRQLRLAAKVAKTFPVGQRASDVPFEVHTCIAQLPEPKRLETLRLASTEHWGLKRAKEVVTLHRQEVSMFEDNDPERFATLIYRAWNNAGPEIREHAWPLIQTAANRGFAIIDEEDAADA